MSLEDVGRLISPEKPQKIVQILEYMADEPRTIEQITHLCNINIWSFRKYLTKMRYYGLVSTTRKDNKTFYWINSMLFDRTIEEKIIDPVGKLTKYLT